MNPLLVNASIVTRRLSDGDASTLLLFMTTNNDDGLREHWPQIYQQVKPLYGFRETMHDAARAALIEVLTRRLAPAKGGTP